jgi:uncharacterized membrane protein YccF (DUF307 family)
MDPNYSFTFINPASSNETIAFGLASAKANHKDYLLTSLEVYQKIKGQADQIPLKFVVVLAYPSGQKELPILKDDLQKAESLGAKGAVVVLNPRLLNDAKTIQEEVEELLAVMTQKSDPLYLYFPYAIKDSEKATLKEAVGSLPQVHIVYQIHWGSSAVVNASLPAPVTALPAPVNQPGPLGPVILSEDEQNGDVGAAKEGKKSHHVMTRIAGILWSIFIGWWLGIFYFILGGLKCATILFIPVGLQLFKVGKLAFSPFGKSVHYDKTNGGKIFLNILWLIFGGMGHVVACFVFGAFLHIFIITIPCGRQMFKFGKLLFQPLGAVITNDLK